MKRTEKRGDCPICGYKNAYSETISRRGKRIGWCASCQDKEAIATYLHGQESGQYAGISASLIQTRAEKAAKALERAQIIWSGAEPVRHDDPAGKYLTMRGIWWDKIGMPSFRYRADCPHPDGRRYPAMLAALLSVDGEIKGIHRTFLTHAGQKADLEVKKASLGCMWGSSIWVKAGTGNNQDVVIAEGIESAASASLICDLPAISAISAGNLASGLVLPASIRMVLIAADNDKPGLVAAERAKERWQAEGRSVRIIKCQAGKDFNDLLLESAK